MNQTEAEGCAWLWGEAGVGLKEVKLGPAGQPWPRGRA